MKIEDYHDIEIEIEIEDYRDIKIEIEIEDYHDIEIEIEDFSTQMCSMENFQIKFQLKA